MIKLTDVLEAYDYANDCKYLRGTTNWCATVAWFLNQRITEKQNDRI